MSQRKRLIIGLGNPGAEYAGTRHNVGFRVIDALAGQLGIALDERHSDAQSGWGRYRGVPVGLARPLTYVNRSGEAVEKLCRRHELDASELLIVVDDLNLEAGAIRLRPRGGSGGHNGLESIAACLDTAAYPRLRLGIGGDFARGRQVDYVLSPFSDEQQPLIEEAIERAGEAALLFLTEGIEPAMNEFN